MRPLPVCAVFLNSIPGNAGVALCRPGIDAARNIGNVLETVALQEMRNLHAARAVVAQAGNGLLRV